MSCCGDDKNKCGCEGDETVESTEDMMNFSFVMDKVMFAEINEAADSNNMKFEEFIYNCIEVGLAITAGDLALIDTDQLDPEDDEEED